MDQNFNDMDPQQAAAALEWLVAMGADEIVLEAPVNRFVTAKPVVQAPPPVTIPAAPANQPTQRVLNLGSKRDDAVSLAAACQSLDDIAAALSGFDACPLKKTATNLVFSDGNPNAHVMFVGEAPGTEEDI